MPPDDRLPFSLLRDRVDLVQLVQRFVQLTRRGREYVGLCPFHSEKTPSFTVNADKKFYHCFGCGAHGDAVGFFAAAEHISYKDAAYRLCKENNIELRSCGAEVERIKEQEHLKRVLQAAGSFFQESLARHSAAFSYLEQRGLSRGEIRAFGIGYAAGGRQLCQYLNQQGFSDLILEKAGLISKSDFGGFHEVFRKRVMFPIKDLYGDVIAFGGRALGEEQPKYLNSPETVLFKKSSSLFGVDTAFKKAYRARHIILVEGYLDVIAMHHAGFEQTVGALGTAVTESHLERLWQQADEVVLCLDNDKAGRLATERLLHSCVRHINSTKQLSVMLLPEGLDPDSAIRQQKASITEAFDARLDFSDALWRHYTSQHKLTSPEGLARLERGLATHIQHIADPTLKKHYYRFFKGRIAALSGPGRGHRREHHWAKPSTSFLAPRRGVKGSQVGEGLKEIEYSIAMLMVLCPSLLSGGKPIFGGADFTQKELKDFYAWLAAQTSTSHSAKEALEEEIKASGFAELYIQKLAPYKKALCGDGGAGGASMEMLSKRHRLELLKSEYLRAMSAGGGDRASLYEQEIDALGKEIAACLWP